MTQDSNNKNSNSSNATSDFDINNITDDDKQLLQWLDIQKCAITISIYSDILAYIATIEGIELIYNKYRKTTIDPNSLPNPDIPALQSVYLGVISRSMTTEIGFLKYDTLYKKYINGEITYSLRPNIDINIANVLGLLAGYYGIRGVEGIYKRNVEQPVLGI